MLRSNLLYHRFMGVERCYVFDDGSTDETLDSVADLNFVIARPAVSASEVPPIAGTAELLPRYDSHFAARQLLNIAFTVPVAREAGFDWLVAIDADEFVIVDRRRALPDGLPQLLQAQPRARETVTFRPLEVVQRRVSYDDVLADETLFKRTGTRARRATWDPFSQRQVRVPISYGHRAGKQAVRLDIDCTPYTSHRFTRPDGAPLRTAVVGELAHYYTHDADAFIRKFRLMSDHPDRHARGGAVDIQKRLWRDVVNRGGLSDSELKAYFERWLMFNQAEVERMSKRSRWPGLEPALVEVTSIRDALSQVRSTTGGH